MYRPEPKSRRHRVIPIAQKFWPVLHGRWANRCLTPCKVFGPDLTKMFRVKHFGKVLSSGVRIDHVRLR